MGVPKQLLKWEDSTLLENTIDTALKLKADEVIVVLGANYNAIKKEIQHYPITILNNKNWQVGLGKSIACGVKHIMKLKPLTNGMLIVLADQPLIDVVYLNTLIQNFKHHKNQIIATSYKKGKQGVPVLFDKVYFEALSKLKEDEGAKQLLKKNQQFVKIIDPQLENIDIDYKSDYEKFIK